MTSDLLQGNKSNKSNYNPTNFQEQEATRSRDQVDPTQFGPQTTLSALVASHTGNLVINESHVLATINPVVEQIAKDKGVTVITLSSKDHPGLLADYILPASITRSGTHFVKPHVLCSTVVPNLGMWEVPVGPIKVMLPRNVADMLDAETVQEAIIETYAAKVGIPKERVVLLGEAYLSEEFTAMTPEVLRKTLERYIVSTLISLNFIFSEPDVSLISYQTLTGLGYTPELKISSSKGDLYRPMSISGQPLPAHAVIEVSAEKTARNQDNNRNGRTDIFTSGSHDRYVATNATVVLDVVFASQVSNNPNDHVPKSHFLAPLLVITNTNFGDSKFNTAGIVSKMLAVLGALAYASEGCATWLNLAIAQQQQFENTKKGNARGIATNWQTLPWCGGAPVIAFDATKSNGQEMAGVLLDPDIGYIYPEPLVSLDLSRGGESGSVDAILLEVFGGNPEALKQVLAALDAATGNRFSAALGNNPIFEPDYDMIVPDGVGNFGGELRNLREITLPAVATRANQSGDMSIVENWKQYQLSTKLNSETALAAVYDQVYCTMCTNLQVNSFYHRLMLTPACVAALENAFYARDTKLGGSLTIRDQANLPAWSVGSQGRTGGLRYTGGVSSSHVTRGGYSTASRGFGYGGNRFNR